MDKMRRWAREQRGSILLLTTILVIPLIVLAGLFVWLKLTEEDDEEALELDEDV